VIPEAQGEDSLTVLGSWARDRREWLLLKV
jgi:hypothetical protein